MLARAHLPGYEAEAGDVMAGETSHRQVTTSDKGITSTKTEQASHPAIQDILHGWMERILS